MNNRADDAARFRQAVESNPADRIAWHNLASAEGDLGHAAESEAAARRAIELGIGAPETRLVLARALQSQRRLDEAENAFAAAIAIRAIYADAHRDLAQLVWMRTGDASAALERLDRVLRTAPHEAPLHLVRSTVLEYAGDPSGALAAAEAGLKYADDDPKLLRQASHLCADAGDAARALDLAERAAKTPDAGGEISVCEALLAAGRLEEADATAAGLCRTYPHNQYALALQATAWRLRGDPRYARLCDYATLVQTQVLDTPVGWPSLEAFLRELAALLESLHPFATHPLQQSVRGGGQLSLQPADLARPLIAALFTSIGSAIQRHLEAIGAGNDALRQRNTGRYGITGAWSVRLRSGGHHADHVHPHGWISSACYIALPATLGGGAQDRAGWLRLGRPAVTTRPPLDADHYVRPEAGRLVLFPAYVWHGVVPFEGDQPRLTVAFDVVPG